MSERLGHTKLRNSILFFHALVLSVPINFYALPQCHFPLCALLLQHIYQLFSRRIIVNSLTVMKTVSGVSKLKLHKDELLSQAV